MNIDRPETVQIDGATATVDFSRFVSGGLEVLVEPATIAAIVSAAIDYYKNKQVGEWQQAVSSELGGIVERLDEIIELIHRAVREIVQNNNENWQDYFSTNIEGPGRSWGYYDSTKSPLTDEEVAKVIDAFTNRLSPAVQSITMNGRFKSWGFTLVDIVRIAFVYSMLALKLANGRLSPRSVKAEVGQNVLDYLVRSTTLGSSEPMSLANALTERRLQLTSHLVTMESWCNGWVRVSDAGSVGGGKERDGKTVVLICRISGGATNPTLGQPLLVDENDARFGCRYYPDYPGLINWHEDEKSRFWCNDRKDRAVTKRNELAQHVSTLAKLLDTINQDIATIRAWMSA